MGNQGRCQVKTRITGRDPFRSAKLEFSILNAMVEARIEWKRRILTKQALRAYYDAADAEASEAYWESVK